MADYFSFEDVMKELELSEEDLKRMVSEGELRAFRDENKMKFKREDVDNLKKGRITEPTIILPSTPSGGGSGQDETVLDLDIQEEQASLTSETAESEPVASESDELMLAPTEDEKTSETEETFIEEESDAGLTTEPLKLADEVESAETVESEIVEEEAIAEEKPRRRTTMRRGGRTGAVAALSATEEAALERGRPSMAWTITLVAAFVLSLYGTLFQMDLVSMESGRQDQPSALTAGMASWVLGNFWGDGAWRKFHEKELPAGGPPYTTEGDAGSRIKLKQNWYKGPSFHLPDHLVEIGQ